MVAIRDFSPHPGLRPTLSQRERDLFTSLVDFVVYTNNNFACKVRNLTEEVK